MNLTDTVIDLVWSSCPNKIEGNWGWAGEYVTSRDGQYIYDPFLWDVSPTVLETQTVPKEVIKSGRSLVFEGNKQWKHWFLVYHYLSKRYWTTIFGIDQLLVTVYFEYWKATTIQPLEIYSNGWPYHSCLPRTWFVVIPSQDQVM